jgi:hypothetical protein
MRRWSRGRLDRSDRSSDQEEQGVRPASFRKWFVLALVALAGVLAVPGTAGAATITVSATTDTGAICTLRNAINSVNSGADMGCTHTGSYGTADTINITASPTITLTEGFLVISKAVAINGPGASNLTINQTSIGTAASVFSIGTVTTSISGLTISGGDNSGTSTAFGGGIQTAGGTLTLDGVVVSDNHATAANSTNGGTATAGGGGIEVFGGTLILKNSTVSGNTVSATETGTGMTNASAFGAGIQVIGSNATVTIDRSTVSGNTATADETSTTAGALALASGGGIASLSVDGTTTISLSTISGNAAMADSPVQEFEQGGGIANSNLTTLKLVSDTIAFNEAAEAANLNRGAKAGSRLVSSIVAEPQVGPNCDSATGLATTDGFNMEDANTCGLGDQSDVPPSYPDTDPMLLPLAQNGGPTQTHALNAGSPAIEFGSSDEGPDPGSNTDQRGTGFTRPVDLPLDDGDGDTSDIGAFEVQAELVSPSAPVLNDTDPDSPSSNNNPKVKGTAEAGSLVFLVFNTCPGTAVATGTAAQLGGTGITATVPSNQTTQIFARAMDAAGNLSPCSAPLTYTEDSSSPDTTITSGPAAASASNSAAFTFTSSEPSSSFQCQLDGGGFSDCNSGQSYAGLANGSHTFMVKATDQALNTDASAASFTWVVDTLAPNTLLGSAKIKRAARKATFNFSSTEPGSTFLCKIDKKPFRSCTSPKKYKKLKRGKHKFQVQSRDIAGNLDGSPAVKKFRI